MIKVVTWLACGFTLLLVACGGGGGGSSEIPDVAPAINTLQFSPQNIVTGSENPSFSGSINFTDDNGDIVAFNIIDSDGNNTLTPTPGLADVTTGVYTFTANFSSNSANTYTFNLWLIDSSGNTSNALTGSIDVYDVTVPNLFSSIPDTGQTQSFTAVFGEDSDYSINPPSFNVIDAETVSDQISGLMWQRSSTTNISWDEGVTSCNNLNLGTHTDWRLPECKELVNILDYGLSSPALDISVFNNVTNTPLVSFWCNEELTSDTSKSWFVRYSQGWVSNQDKATPTDAICVRGASASTSFVDLGDGLIKDERTNLIWQSASSVNIMNWEDAIKYCENNNYAGYSNWRLPNIKELYSLVDTSTIAPSIDETFFLNTRASYYWSSTHQIHGVTNAWPVTFDEGAILNYGQDNGASVRCVTSD